MCYFKRHHINLEEKLNYPQAFAAGDIVIWDLGDGLFHIGIVSDRKAENIPLIIHNIGAGAQEESILYKYKIIGHYRLKHGS